MLNHTDTSCSCTRTLTASFQAATSLAALDVRSLTVMYRPLVVWMVAPVVMPMVWLGTSYTGRVVYKKFVFTRCMVKSCTRSMCTLPMVWLGTSCNDSNGVQVQHVSMSTMRGWLCVHALSKSKRERRVSMCFLPMVWLGVHCKGSIG